MAGTNVKFDDDPRNIVINIIKSKCLDHLPHQVPYQLNPVIQMWEVDENWSKLTIVCSVEAKTKALFMLIIGRGGTKVKVISDEIQDSLVNFFSHEVHFKMRVIPMFSTPPVKENEKSTIKPNLFL